MRIREDAVTWAQSQHVAPSRDWTGQCLGFVRSCFGAGAYLHDAYEAWRLAKYKHTTGTPPAGVPVFWKGGSKGYGHIALSAGGGYVWSTDVKRRGQVDKVSIGAIARAWNQRYLGWTEDVNGIRVYTHVVTRPAPAVARPANAPVDFVSLNNLRPGMHNEDVAQLQAACRRHGYGRLNPHGVTGYYGGETLAMVAAFQRAQGWHGADADGRPGPETLRRLGLRAH